MQLAHSLTPARSCNKYGCYVPYQYTRTYTTDKYRVLVPWYS